MILIKWIVLMTYLATPSPSAQLLSGDETEPEPLSDCATMPEGVDDVLGCIHGATPEPVVYRKVTKFLSYMYDTYADCQRMADDAMARHTAAEPSKRLYRGLTLTCKLVEIPL